MDDTQGQPSPAPDVPRRRILPTGFASLRDATTFLFGMGIIGNEVFVQPTVEVAAIAVGVTMAGLPVVFAADEKRRDGGKP